MGAALALLHGSAFSAALALLWWRDHAAVFSWRRRAVPAPAPANAGAAA
jgi:lipopolysaccharide export system permease protein